MINIAIMVSSRSEQSFPPGVAYLHISLWLFGRVRACSPRGRSQGITTALAAIFINFIVIICRIDTLAGSWRASTAIEHGETCEIAHLREYFGRGDDIRAPLTIRTLLFALDSERSYKMALLLFEIFTLSKSCRCVQFMFPCVVLIRN